MDQFDASLRCYYSQVKSWLPCSHGKKKQIIQRLQASVSAYREQNPDADFEQIQAHFGTPETIASAYVDEMGTDALLRHLRIRRKVFAIVSGAMAAVLAVWLLAVGWAVTNEHASSGGSISKIVIMNHDNETDFDLEEFT